MGTSGNVATIDNTGTLSGNLSARAGSADNNTNNTATIKNTGIITNTGGLGVIAGGSANNTATIKNTGIITNTGGLGVIAGGSANNTHNTASLENVSALTIFGPAELFVVADGGTPSVPEVAYAYFDVPIVVEP